jgi:hypothetical protein
MLAGLIAGAAWGVGARVAMRVVAVAAGERPEFSLGATLAILLFTAFVGVPAGLVFTAVRRFVSGPAWRQGLVFGVVVLLVLGTLLYRSPFQQEAVELGLLPLTIGMFGPLLLLAGVAVALVHGPLERRLPAGPLASVLILLGPIAYEVVLIVIAMTVRFD